MAAKIQHVAIMTENFVRERKFYESAIGMRRSKSVAEQEARAVEMNYGLSVSDGYVGMTIIGRKPGYICGLHHFGIEVDDVEGACARMREKYPGVKVLKRPSNRPFASFGAHDPEGNIFDLTQEGMENKSGVYVESDREHKRRINHIKLRVVHPKETARFYVDVFDFQQAEKALEDPNFYLTDGKVTLVIAPWDITDYDGAGLERPGLEHIGFKVESVEAVKRDLDELRKADPEMRERTVSVPSEGERRVELIAGCRHGRHQLSDPGGVFIDISE
jgi:catechol 2,3-dioxygenase-like lactoylglutathione lyase family enzyme